MATCKEEHCVVCLIDLPKSSTRRRLHSESTNHIVPVLCKVTCQSFPAEIVSALFPCGSDLYLCRPCFKNAEKLLQLRNEVFALECKLADLLKISVKQRELNSNVPAPAASDGSLIPHQYPPTPLTHQHPTTPLTHQHSSRLLTNQHPSTRSHISFLQHRIECHR